MRLFRPAWDSKNEKRAVKAVEKLTDEVLLARIAKEARCWRARIAAVEKLTDQNVLADIAENANEYHLRKAAVEKLTELNVLADVAKNGTDSYDRKKAVKKLTDQSVLAYVAKNNTNSNVRIVAAKKLIDKTMRNADMDFMLFTSLFIEFDDDLAHLVLRAFDRISVSLDGGAGAFARTCGNLGRLVELKRQSEKPCSLSIRATLTRAQKERGVDREVRNIAKTLGVPSVNISNVLPIGRAKLLEEAKLSMPKPPENPAHFFASFAPRNSCGLCSNPHITPQGDIYPCWAYLEEGKPLGNVRDGLKTVLYDFLWGSRKYEFCTDHSEKCRNCDARYLCGGVCRAYKNSDCSALRDYWLRFSEN